MKQRLVICLILTSMMLHCFSRIGFLSYLYQQRHEIAYTIGLIAEMPIALCTSNHFDSGTLILQTASDNDESLPVSFLTHEINLFFDVSIVTVAFNPFLLKQFTFGTYEGIILTNPPQRIFQPPRL